VAVVLRCPKCQGRYQPIGSLESGDLDTRCPHCARQKEKKQLKRAAREAVLAPDLGGNTGSNVVLVSALLAGAVLVILVVVIIVVGAMHSGESRGAAGPAAATSPHRTPTTTSTPPRSARKPRTDREDPPPERFNDPNWKDDR
jgi:hypothetical protein